MNVIAELNHIVKAVANPTVKAVLEDMVKLNGLRKQAAVDKMWQDQILQITREKPENWADNLNAAFTAGQLTPESLKAILLATKELFLAHRLPKHVALFLIKPIHHMLAKADKYLDVYKDVEGAIEASVESSKKEE